jgi:hypothetical protein
MPPGPGEYDELYTRVRTEAAARLECKPYMKTTPIRPELEPLPKLMQDLPIDERGYVVPWFCEWIDGKPEFRAMDGRKYRRALNEKLCWVCGRKLAGVYVFVAGPMCGINRTSSEPPCHIDCGRWSARNCPFLTKPDMVRREDEQINNAKMRANAPGKAITRNPGVALLWFTREYEVFDDGRGNPLIQMGRPSGVEWYCRGRAATREEVEESIDSGLPALEAIARTQEGAIEELYRKRKAFERWLPR